ncbi:MAG: VOC family protein [Acidimicrobiales bacterium]|jgi:glyoxylase I family protein
MPPILGYHHLSLSVTDVDRSVAWYHQALGLETHSVVEGAGFRRTRLRSPGAGVILTLTGHDGRSGAEPFDERRVGMDHVSFRVAGVDEVDALKRRFEELGIEHSEIKASSGGTAMITLRDPDNIQLEVFGGPAPGP